MTNSATNSDPTWPPGSTILYRYGRGGQARFVRVGTVIHDDADGLTLWVAPGSPQIVSILADGRPIRSVPLEQRARFPRARKLSTWHGTGIVMFVPTSEEWSVWWFYRDDGSFAGWYGNLESPRVRWTGNGLLGVDTADRALDVLVSPDRVPRWKDLDEFATFTGEPNRWTAEQAPAIRAAGERLMELARAGDPPFDGRFTDFRPDPAWPCPVLPDDWDRPHLAEP